MPSFERDGLSLHYREKGTGRPLVLLHPFALEGETFRSQLDELSKGCRVIIPDLRGFGQSAFTGDISTMAQMAGDVLHLLDLLKVDKTVVAGVSMGGYVCLSLVELGAGRVEGVILADTQATPEDEGGQAARLDTARAVEAQGVNFLVTHLLPRLLTEDCDQGIRVDTERMMRSSSPQACAAALRGIASRSDGRGILARFAGSVLVIVGENDEVTPRSKAQQMVDLSSQSEFAQIPRAGHLSYVENPAAFNEAILTFLRHLKD